MKKISIVVPVYKVEKYLNKCVDSVVNQTYKNLEIILVNDGSPDNCPSICDALAEKDSRIKVVHKENGGLADARNNGIAVSTGEYIMFVDGDDYIEPDMVEFLYDLITKNDSDVARCGLFLDYTDGRTRVVGDDKILYPDKNEIIIDLVNPSYNGGIVCNKMYKASVIKNVPFCKEDGSSEDIMFNYRVYSKTDKAVFCDMPKYHYIIREGSITNNEFSYGAFSITNAKRKILDDNINNNATKPYCIMGYIESALIVLSGVITNQKCLDRYDELRKSILSHRKEILFSNLYSKRDKIKVIILSISPRLFNKLTMK